MELHFDMLTWIAAAFGLLIGSFLNVVIHRLPSSIEPDWVPACSGDDAACRGRHAVLAAEAASHAPTARLTLITPGSHCPHCLQPIRWYQNIPVLSYLALRGHCASCKSRISLRYPLVELATAALFAFCVAHWGAGPTGLAWCSFSAALLTLALIDWDTTLLPDSITLPLLWAGLLASALQWTATPLPDAVYGAAMGYVSLWLVYWGFKLVTGKEGMGYGDFKLFAALGAWLGWQALLPVILIASVLGLIAGLVMHFTGKLREGGYIPFGPFLAGAGFAAMVWGSDLVLRSLSALVEI